MSDPENISVDLDSTVEPEDIPSYHEGDENFYTPMKFNLPDVDRRLSASQPILSKDTANDRKCSSLTSMKHNERFPYLKVMEDNEQFQAKVRELNALLIDARTRQRFAEEQLPRPVQEIMSDYLELQRQLRDGQEKIEDYDQLFKKYEIACNENEKLGMTIRRLEMQIEEKNQEMERQRREFLMNNHEEFTLNSDSGGEIENKTVYNELNNQKLLNHDYLVKIADLESVVATYKDRLSELEQQLSEKEGLTKTFILNENELKLAQRIDELHSENIQLRNRYNTCNQALVHYLNTVNKLEKKLVTAGMSASQLMSSSFDIADRARVEQLLEKMKNELLVEKQRNRNLRTEVNKLLGQNDSNSSEESVEAATEAIESYNLNDSREEENKELCREADEMLVKLQALGWMDKTADGGNEDLDSFDNLPVLDIGNKDVDLFEKLSQQEPIVVPAASDHINLLNSSMGHILQTSMNAVSNITALKDDLITFRDVLSDMFDRLKGSAALLDEIRQKLANGDHSPLADTIQEMHLQWAEAAKKIEVIARASENAERSIVGLQAHISVLEQSIVQTSFVLDHTKRMTISNVSFLEGAKTEAFNQTYEFARVQELEAQLEEAIKARDSALCRIEFFDSLAADHDNVLHEKEELLNKYTNVVDELEDIKKELSHSEKMQKMANDHLVERNERIDSLMEELAKQRSFVDALTRTRDDLSIKVVELGEQVERLKTLLENSEIGRQEIYEKLEELQETEVELRNDLNSAQLTIQDKSQEMLQAQERTEKQINMLTEKCVQLSDQLEASRVNVDQLQAELNQIAFKAAKETRTNSTWSPTPRQTVSPNTSLLAKSTMPQKSSQTEITSEVINDIQGNNVKLQEEIDRLLSSYVMLEKKLSGYLFKGDFNLSKNVAAVKTSCEKLLAGIDKKKKIDDDIQDQINKLEEDLNSQSLDVTTHKAKTVTYNKTEPKPEYKARLSRDIYIALVKIMDLTQNLKCAEEGKKKGYKFDLEPLINDAREVRTLLNDVRGYLSVDKENAEIPPDTAVAMVLSMRRDNKEIYNQLKELSKKYEDMHKNTSDPDLIFKIDKELGKIHKTMNNVKTAASQRVQKYQ